MKLEGFMEFVCVVTESSKYDFKHNELLKAAEESQIPTFGWPIGIVISHGTGKPVPYQDGIKAQVLTEHRPFGQTFDYWNLRRNGDYYLEPLTK